MSATAIVILCIAIVFLTLAVEAGIQDRIKFNDSTWFSWFGRKVRNYKSAHAKKPRTVKSTK